MQCARIGELYQYDEKFRACYVPIAGYFKVVCYFTNWAWYRQGVGKYLPETIDEQLCTHIVYGFAVLDYENLIVKAHDSWADYDNSKCRIIQNKGGTFARYHAVASELHQLSGKLPQFVCN
jgi:Chitinase